MKRGHARRWLLSVAALLLLLILFDLYARSVASFTVAPISLDPRTRTAVLLFHGSNGREDANVLALERRLRALVGGVSGVEVRLYVWSPHSDTKFRAAANGEHVGRLLGEELGRMPALQAVHLIGHSAGAYIPDGLCEALKKASAGRVRVDVTYLDPIGFKGALDSGWGARHYGQCADYAEAYINTDDIVPATNTPLEHAWNVDVTEAGKRSGFNDGGHRWPLRYYEQMLTAEEALPGAHEHAQRARGVVEQR